MKFKVIELINNALKDNNIEGVISYKDKENDEYLSIDDAVVDGYYEYVRSEELFIFHLHVTTSIVSPCVRTLKPVKVLVDFDTDLFYTFKVVDDDSFPIVGNTIELDEEIWGEIILHMPLRVLSEDAEYQDEEINDIEKRNPFSILNNIEDKGEE